MIGTLFLALFVLVGPERLTVTTQSGVARIDMRIDDHNGSLVPLSALADAVGGEIVQEVPWVSWQTAGSRFRFLTGSPFVSDGVDSRMLPAMTLWEDDSVWVPLSFVAEVLVGPKRPDWTWDPVAVSIVSGDPTSPLLLDPTGVSRDTVTKVRSGPAPIHHVTIDAGHGGTDPGNLGRFLPRGVNEKHVTLAVSLLLRDELEARGVRVTMTRTTDTLINLGHRAPQYCGSNCDLFVSIHVNDLPRRPGYETARGFETYFQAEAKTADAARVAATENDAARFEIADIDEEVTGLDFILKDLRANEYMRESGRAAELIQNSLRGVHSGPDRGVKQAGFTVLNTAKTPAVLVELGFSTNREDARLLSSATGQRSITRALADAITTWLSELDRRTGAAMEEGQ